MLKFFSFLRLHSNIRCEKYPFILQLFHEGWEDQWRGGQCLHRISARGSLHICRQHNSSCLKVWENDMIFKDQDDCSKRLLCELNAMRKEGKVGKVETVKKSDGKKLCSDGNLKRQGEQMVVVKVWCHLCNFQELSEDAKVLVDAYGENMIVFLQNFH